MKTEHQLAFELKNMMSKKSIEEISIDVLVKKCKVSRQTFYYYYHDIYDLLTQVFLDEEIPNIEEVTNYKEMLKCISEYFDKNFKFLKATTDSAGKSLLLEFLDNRIYRTFLKILNKDDNEAKKIARFYANSFANSLCNHLEITKDISFNKILSLFDFIKDDFLLETYSNVTKNKGE